MNIGIIGYGSMGKMLLQKISETGKVNHDKLFVSNRNLYQTGLYRKLKQLQINM